MVNHGFMCYHRSKIKKIKKDDLPPYLLEIFLRGINSYIKFYQIYFTYKKEDYIILIHLSKFTNQRKWKNVISS